MGTALLCCSALKWMWIIDIFTAVLISSEFISTPHPFSIFSLAASKVLCPWLCLILNRFMRTFVSYFLFSRIVKTDCQRATDWVESPHRLSSYCQAPHIHLWGGFNKANWAMTLLSRLCGCYYYEVRGIKIVDYLTTFQIIIHSISDILFMIRFIQNILYTDALYV